MEPQKLEVILRTLPEDPGVYQYFDAQDKIIYVGKAKNLKRRVSSYFNREIEHPKTRVMVSKIERIEFIVVGSEADALLLENNLIKKFRPRYNVLLKDDKTYPWICFKNEPFPRVFLTRRKTPDGSLYFGPYTSVKNARGILDIIKGVFPLRTCSLALSTAQIEKGKFKECLEYHIKNCLGPCIGEQSRAEYEENIEAVKNFLRGNLKPLIQDIRKKMNSEAARLRFEKAEIFRQRLEILENYQARSTVSGNLKGSIDVFSIASDSEYGYVNHLHLYQGAVVRSYTLEIRKRLDESDKQLLELGIAEIRSRFESSSREILVPEKLDIDLGEEIKIRVPLAGDKKQLIDLSLKNARMARLEKYKQEKIADPQRHTDRLMATMMKDLQLDREPRHIECFDNSNTQGTNPVSSCVVFKDGRPSKKDYRHFNVRTVVGPDDFATMQEVVHRRYSRLLEEGQPLPDLIIVDGGKGQLSATMEIIDRLGLRGKITVIGIAKRLEELFYPEDPVPLYLDRRSPTLKIIQQLRDEAHRFGITHHRNRRSRAALESELFEIRGVGQATAEKLLKHFKSLKKIKEAEPDDLADIVGNALGDRIYSFFHP